MDFLKNQDLARKKDDPSKKGTVRNFYVMIGSKGLLNLVFSSKSRAW